MIVSARVKWGDPNQPVRMTLVKALFALLLSPLALIIQLVIGLLVILLDVVQLGMYHLTFKCEGRDILMPDGTIRKPKTKAHE